MKDCVQWKRLFSEQKCSALLTVFVMMMLYTIVFQMFYHMIYLHNMCILGIFAQIISVSVTKE